MKWKTFQHQQNTILTSSVKKVRTVSHDYLVSINHPPPRAHPIESNVFLRNGTYLLINVHR